ncbi:MAG: Gfo/Idh/MocA family oxidoreductase [Candidatus Paceibacterota bacterium]|jgi:predicted dehydrogenase
MNIGIIGAGLIGNKRAQTIEEIGKDVIVAIADIEKNKAIEFSRKYQCRALDKWQKMVKMDGIDAIIIAVPNKWVAPIAIEALKQKKHILCEKPFGRNASESKQILETAKRNKCLVKVGFNHRFHPAIWKAKEIINKNKIGKVIFIRARYGHGGRLGMEKEWRANKNISGGGELLDQGVHLIDLARWFAGEIREVFGVVETKFWDMKVEDNAFVIMKNDDVTVEFHVSWTNWKNIFSFEIFGEKGFLQIEGLGGSYGKEKLIFGERNLGFGIPKIQEFEFEKDLSWQEEWKNFRSAVLKKEKMIGDGNDGLKANQIVEAIYQSSKIKKIVSP